jgi:hypothetical protein
MRPPASRLADLAVSAAKASTESLTLRSEREWVGQQPLMPDEALAELPPTYHMREGRTEGSALSQREEGTDGSGEGVHCVRHGFVQKLPGGSRVESSQTKPSLAKPSQIKSSQVKPSQVKLRQIKPRQVKSSHATFVSLSRTTTLAPRSSKRSAVVMPATPVPTTTTSGAKLGVLLVAAGIAEDGTAAAEDGTAAARAVGAREAASSAARTCAAKVGVSEKWRAR